MFAWLFPFILVQILDIIFTRPFLSNETKKTQGRCEERGNMETQFPDGVVTTSPVTLTPY